MSNKLDELFRNFHTPLMPGAGMTNHQKFPSPFDSSFPTKKRKSGEIIFSAGRTKKLIIKQTQITENLLIRVRF